MAQNKGNMTVQEAGQRGGETVSRKYGHEHFQKIGQMGGQRVRELISEGKQSEQKSSTRGR